MYRTLNDNLFPVFQLILYFSVLYWKFLRSQPSGTCRDSYTCKPLGRWLLRGSAFVLVWRWRRRRDRESALTICRPCCREMRLRFQFSIEPLADNLKIEPTKDFYSTNVVVGFIFLVSLLISSKWIAVLSICFRAIFNSFCRAKLRSDTLPALTLSIIFKM